MRSKVTLLVLFASGRLLPIYESLIIYWEFDLRISYNFFLAGNQFTMLFCMPRYFRFMQE